MSKRDKFVLPPSETAYPYSTLEHKGLYIGRPTSNGDLSAVVSALGRYRRVFAMREHFDVNVLLRREVRQQRALGNVTLKAATNRIQEHVPSVTQRRRATLDGVVPVPKRDGSKTLLLARFDTQTKQETVDERGQIIDALKSFRPEADYDWADWSDYRDVGIPVGVIKDNQDDSALALGVVAQVIEEVLPKDVWLAKADFIPTFRSE